MKMLSCVLSGKAIVYSKVLGRIIYFSCGHWKGHRWPLSKLVEIILYFHFLKDESWNFAVKGDFLDSAVYPHSKCKHAVYNWII